MSYLFIHILFNLQWTTHGKVLNNAHVTLYELLSYQMPGGTEQKHETLSWQLVSGMKFQCGNSRIKKTQLLNPHDFRRSVYHFCNIYKYIYIQSNEIHNVVALIMFLLVLRFQLKMFRTVTVHPQEFLCRYCMCRLWYVL